jgi:hypothetical protein
MIRGLLIPERRFAGFAPSGEVLRDPGLILCITFFGHLLKPRHQSFVTTLIKEVVEDVIEFLLLRDIHGKRQRKSERPKDETKRGTNACSRYHLVAVGKRVRPRALASFGCK